MSIIRERPSFVRIVNMHLVILVEMAAEVLADTLAVAAHQVAAIPAAHLAVPAADTASDALHS